MTMAFTTQSLRHEMTLLAPDGGTFRTNRLTGIFAVPLRASTAAEYAILPGLLTGGCRAYPTMTALNTYLDDLYGATVEADTLRLGEWQVLRFSISYLRSRYALDGEDLSAACTDLLLDLLFDPALTDGAFSKSDFDREQRCLSERLQSELNNKRRYAREQCMQLLCPDHPYSVNPSGTPETIAALTPAIAADARMRLLSTARIHWIWQGEERPDRIQRVIEQRFDTLPYRQAVRLEPDHTFAMKESERTDTMALQQAKLVLGLRIAVTEPDEAVDAARLFNTLLGASPSSLLFRHVREEQSLCYYCSSSYDRLQGVILIDSGVEAANAERTKEEILRQLDAIRQGNFSDGELEDARRALIQQFAAMDETPATREAFFLSQTVYDRYRTPEQTGNALRNITREDVIRVARSVHMDTTYLLKPTDKEGSDQ